MREINFTIKSDGTQEMKLFLTDTIKITEEVEEAYLRRSAKLVKSNIVKNLKHFESDISKAGYKHMAEDVTYSIVKDKYGDKVAKVKGGRKTGSKWHLVNDGTYRSRATHFMDAAMEQSERELEQMLDDELRKAGF